MAKLHEIVAVEKDKRTKLSKLTEETAKTFSQRQDHFTGMRRTYRPLNDNDPDIFDPEVKVMTTTVGAKLEYFESEIADVLNVINKKEATNCVAHADIAIGETVIAKGVPLLMLIQLENILSDLRGKVYAVIPTLDPSKDWETDANNIGVYTNKEPSKQRTKKIPKAIVKYDATDKHPAQTDLVMMDEVVGYFDEVKQSGMYSVKEKHELLTRLDKIIQAVKEARARANSVETLNVENVGTKIFNFINKK